MKVESDGVLRIVSRISWPRSARRRSSSRKSKVKAETEIRTKLAEAQLKEQEALARQAAPPSRRPPS